MGRIARRGVRGDVVQTGCAESSHGTVGHRLATCHRTFIFEVKQDIGFSRGIKGFGVKSYTK